MKLKWLLIVTALDGIAMNVIFYFYLPETVATHFNFAGQANSFGTRTYNLIFWIVLFIILNALWLMIPILVKKLPASMVNIPNGEYWLSPERKDATIPKIAHWMNIFGIITNIFLCGICIILFVVNTSGDAHMNFPLLMTPLAGYMIAFIAWLIFFLSAFKKENDAR